MSKLLDWVASRFPLNIKYNARCHSNHAGYVHPLDTPLVIDEAPSVLG